MAGWGWKFAIVWRTQWMFGVKMLPDPSMLQIGCCCCKRPIPTPHPSTNILYNKPRKVDGLSACVNATNMTYCGRWWACCIEKIACSKACCQWIHNVTINETTVQHLSNMLLIVLNMSRGNETQQYKHKWFHFGVSHHKHNSFCSLQMKRPATQQTGIIEEQNII